MVKGAASGWSHGKEGATGAQVKLRKEPLTGECPPALIVSWQTSLPHVLSLYGIGRIVGSPQNHKEARLHLHRTA